jgi:hypothetical protein
MHVLDCQAVQLHSNRNVYNNAAASAGLSLQCHLHISIVEMHIMFRESCCLCRLAAAGTRR